MFGPRLVTSFLLAAGMMAAPPAFEVASVKPNPTRDGHSSTNISMDKDAAKLTLEHSSLFRCIQAAYGVKEYQIEGPDWLKSEEYDIVGTVSSRIPREEIWPMLQTLLAERFKLTLHRETRMLPVYDLVVGKSGAKIQPVDPEGSSGTWQGADTLTAKKEPMDHFAGVLSRIVDRPVLDKTGLAGAYDFTLQYSRDDVQSTYHSDHAVDAPSIFTALQEKLGLKLEGRKGPVEILVIDHVEKVPAEN